MGPRRKAREYALQMLFQWDITHDMIDQIAVTFFQNQEEGSQDIFDFALQFLELGKPPGRPKKLRFVRGGG